VLHELVAFELSHLTAASASGSSSAQSQNNTFSAPVLAFLDKNRSLPALLSTMRQVRIVCIYTHT